MAFLGAAIPAIAGLAGTASAIKGLVGGGGTAGGGGTVDPTALANAQAQANIRSSQAQSALQNVNTISPYGTSLYTPFTDPVTGEQRYQLNQALSPELQSLFETQVGGSQALANMIATQAGTSTGLAATGAGVAQRGAGFAGDVTAAPANLPAPLSNLTPGSFRTDVTTGAGGQALPQVQTGVNADFPQLVQQAQDAAYKSQTQYLDPQFAQARQQKEQELADQGLQPGSEAYDREIGDFNRQQQMAYGNAQMQAVQAGNEQQRALFGQSLASGQFTNQANQQLFGQGMSLADLYNQAVLGSAQQNLQAQQANLNLAQTAWQDPQTALANLIASGGGLYGTGMGTLGTLAGLANIAPQWPLGIPTQGAQPITSTAPNLGAAVQGAAQQNLVGTNQFNRNLTNLSTGVKDLFGSPGTGGVGLGGFFGGLFGTGGGSNPGAVGDGIVLPTNAQGEIPGTAIAGANLGY